MKKKMIFLLIVLMMVFAVPVCHADAVTSFDYDAFDMFAVTWNMAMREMGLPITFLSESDDGGFWASCLSDIDQPTTIVDTLSNQDIPVQMIMNYWPADDTFSLFYKKNELTEKPSALGFYIDGVKHEASIQYFPSEQESEEDTLQLTITADAAGGIIHAQECFLRLTTDIDSYFLDVNLDTTPVPYIMLNVLYNGHLYSCKDSDYYKDEELLWLPAQTAAVSETSAPAQTISFQNDYEAIDRAAQSVFLLEVYDEKAQMIATGSGFLAFDGSTLVTNAHVIKDAAYIVAHSDKYAASYKLTEVKAADAEKDIALLVFDASASVKPLEVDLHSRILRGQPVTAIGSPEGVINTVSSGNISNVIHYSESIPDCIQFTAPISPGSSGGALFNEAGAIIGLCKGGHALGESMYYAIPIKYVEEMYQETKGNKAIALTVYNLLPNELAAPVLDTPKSTKDGIQLKWSSANYAEAYEIYRSKDRKIGFTRIATVQKASYLDTQAEPGELYWYQIRVYNSWEGLSDASNTRSGMVPVPTPTPTPKPTPMPAGTALYSLGDMADEILSIKIRLYELGYLYASKNFDNHYDQALKSAVVNFQARNKFEQTGEVDKKTLTALKAANAIRGPFGVPSKAITLLKNTYQLNDKGSAITELKKQMKVMGYYKASATFDDEYNKTMVERVQLFQKNNGLEETGIIDCVTIIKLYYAENVKGPWYVVPTPTPPPTSKYLIFSDEESAGYRFKNDNQIQVRFSMKNTSSNKTITAYELYAYTVDSNGREIISKSEPKTLSVKATLKPGQTKQTPLFTLTGKGKVKDIYVAIHKIKYSDGTTYTAFHHDYCYWTVP